MSEELVTKAFYSLKEFLNSEIKELNKVLDKNVFSEQIALFIGQKTQCLLIIAKIEEIEKNIKKEN